MGIKQTGRGVLIYITLLKGISSFPCHSGINVIMGNLYYTIFTLGLTHLVFLIFLAPRTGSRLGEVGVRVETKAVSISIHHMLIPLLTSPILF